MNKCDEMSELNGVCDLLVTVGDGNSNKRANNLYMINKVTSYFCDL